MYTMYTCGKLSYKVCNQTYLVMYTSIYYLRMSITILFCRKFDLSKRQTLYLLLREILERSTTFLLILLRTLESSNMT